MTKGVDSHVSVMKKNYVGRGMFYQPGRFLSPGGVQGALLLLQV